MQQGTEDKELSTNKYPLYLQLLDARPIPTASFLLVEDSKDMNRFLESGEYEAECQNSI